MHWRTEGIVAVTFPVFFHNFFLMPVVYPLTTQKRTISECEKFVKGRNLSVLWSNPSNFYICCCRSSQL